MSRGGDLITDDLLKFFGGHPRVSGYGEFEECVLTASQRGFYIALQHRGEWYRGLLPRMLRRELPNPVEDEERLEIHRLLGPQTANVVEHRDTLGWGHKIR